MNRDKRLQCLIKQIVKETECTEQDAQRYIRIVLDEYADKYISALLKNDYLKIYYGCLSEHYLIKGDMDKATEYLDKSIIIDKKGGKQNEKQRKVCERDC